MINDMSYEYGHDGANGDDDHCQLVSTKIQTIRCCTPLAIERTNVVISDVCIVMLTIRSL
jgi:hypothetical protein